MSPRILEQRNVLLYRNEHTYSSWPTILKLSGTELLLLFNEGMRRFKTTHSDPTFLLQVLRSTDGGMTWDSQPLPVGGYTTWGMEAGGAVRLRNGVILIQNYRPQYFTKYEMKKRYEAEWDYTSEQSDFPWHQIHGNFNYLYRSTDGGRTWEGPVWFDASPYRMAFMMRAAVELPSGELLMPCADDSFLGYGSAYVMKSEDEGKTWTWFSTIVGHPKYFSTEPALLLLPSGKLIALIRTHGMGEYYLYQSVSTDEGRTWSDPIRTPMWGYPAHMLSLQDGSILCVRGHRREPFGIRATLSYDQGETWDINDDIGLREDFPNADLGYPTSIQLDNGEVLTVYYGTDQNGVTSIYGSFYSLG